MSLETEHSVYEAILPALIQAGREGQYVVIRGQEILGFYESMSAALRAGYERFGLDEPFMARPVLAPERDRPKYFSRRPYQCPLSPAASTSEKGH